MLFQKPIMRREALLGLLLAGLFSLVVGLLGVDFAVGADAETLLQNNCETTVPAPGMVRKNGQGFNGTFGCTGTKNTTYTISVTNSVSEHRIFTFQFLSVENNSFTISGDLKNFATGVVTLLSFTQSPTTTVIDSDGNTWYQFTFALVLDQERNDSIIDVRISSTKNLQLDNFSLVATSTPGWAEYMRFLGNQSLNVPVDGDTIVNDPTLTSTFNLRGRYQPGRQRYFYLVNTAMPAYLSIQCTGVAFAPTTPYTPLSNFTVQCYPPGGDPSQIPFFKITVNATNNVYQADLHIKVSFKMVASPYLPSQPISEVFSVLNGPFQ